jgi:hypothetical protein
MAGFDMGTPEFELPACVQCGYCCTVSPCGYGDWDAERHRCKWLGEDMKCKRYKQVHLLDMCMPYPMWGTGCSSSLCNPMREIKIRELKMKGEL